MKNYICYDYYGNRRIIEARSMKSAVKIARKKWGEMCNVYKPNNSNDIVSYSDRTPICCDAPMNYSCEDEAYTCKVCDSISHIDP
jgi:hypothetical protein